MVLTDLPTALTLDLGAEVGSIDLNTSGAALGGLEVLLTSGPLVTVPAGVDGVVARDIASHYALAARITGLRRVSASQSPLDVFLDTTAGRPFRLDLRDQALTGGGETYTVARIDALQRNTRLLMDDVSDNAQRISYSADAATTSLTLDTNSGEPDPVTGRVRTRMTANVSPLPASLTTCFAAKPRGSDASRACGRPDRPAGEGSFRVVASEPTMLNLFDCTDNNPDCGSPESQLRITNLGVQKIEVNLETGQSCNSFGCSPEGSSGSIWLDTDNVLLAGSLFWDDGGPVEITVNFPDGFRSNDRFARWAQFERVEQSGTVTCPSGTRFDVELSDFLTIDVAARFLC